MSARERLFLPAISLVRLLSPLPNILTGLLLIEIAASFGTSVGVMGQVRTFSSGVGVVVSLLMGALSVWFGHKLLFVTGVGLLAASAFLCNLALEQIPPFKGIRMSINQAAGSLGSTLLVMGGWALLEYRFRYLGALIAVLNIIAFVVYWRMVKDPLSRLGSLRF